MDREEKRAEIVAIAERRLREDGYPGLSVASIARELGLAQNAVYWYFPSKDHLFVAALEEMIRSIMTRKPPRRGGVEQRVTWLVDQLADIDHVRAAMHERARVAPVVAEFAGALDATWRRMLDNALSQDVPETERPLAVATLLATIQGLLAQRLSRAERRPPLEFAIRRLTAPERRAVSDN